MKSIAVRAPVGRGDRHPPRRPRDPSKRSSEAERRTNSYSLTAGDKLTKLLAIVGHDRLADVLLVAKEAGGGSLGFIEVFDTRINDAAVTSVATSERGAIVWFEDLSGRIDFNSAFIAEDPVFLRGGLDPFEWHWARGAGRAGRGHAHIFPTAAPPDPPFK